VGLGLKRFQREEVLRQGLSEVRWTFDPLRSRNAFFNLRRLGVQADSYRVNYYGPMGSDTNRGLRTDRLRVRWELSTAIVVERVAGRYPTAEQDLARFRACRPLVETESVGGTIRVPTTVTRPSGPDVCIEVPLDFDAVRARGAEPIGAWREATRAAFESALDAGYRTDDFAVVPVDGERRAFYLLSLRPPDPRGPER
jgi:predicted GNAT superfamily acetyltransferase